MAKQKIKINPKKFVQDFRSGMSDDELMLAHGLTPIGLEKVLHMLEEKHLLDVAEISRDITVPTMQQMRRGRGNRLRPLAEESTVLTPIHGFPNEPPKDSATKCPQCGADVPEIALTCPECGHVLPGSQRWEEAEAEESLWERVPPIVWGCIFASPIVVIFFWLLAYVMLPAGESRIDKRISTIRQEAARKPTSTVAGIGSESSSRGGEAGRPLHFELDRLVAEGVLTNVGEDLSLLRAGDRWTELPDKHLAEKMAVIVGALRQARLDPTFQVLDSEGWVVAECSETFIRIFKEGRVSDWQLEMLSGDRQAGPAEKKPSLPVEQASQ